MVPNLIKNSQKSLVFLIIRTKYQTLLIGHIFKLKFQNSYQPFSYQCNKVPFKKMDWNHFGRDMACGTLSGIANCLSGYIFDTLKVRMQMDHSLTMIASLQTIIKNQGFMNLFNGMYYPFITVPVVNAIVFSSYELFKKITKKKQLSLMNGIQNGAFAGLVNTIVVSPVELVKCHMQLDKEFKYKASADCAKEIIRTQGIKGLFKGGYATAFREVFGYSAQFAAYQFLKQKLVSKDHPNLTFSEGLIVGIIAGVSCWIFSYPQDIIKTTIQVSKPGTYKPIYGMFDGGFYECGRQIYKNSGWKGFWIGIQPCLVRAAVANAFGIAVYEQCQFYFTHSRTLENY